MRYYHLDKNEWDEVLNDIANKVNYSGRKIKLSMDYIPSNLNSYWDSGSRDYFYFYQLSSGKMLGVESNHPMFEPNKPRELKDLPHDIILIEHSIFCGKDMGLTIYTTENNRARLLPQNTNEQLTEDEKIVLKYTKSLKNSYGGRTNIRFKEAHEEKGISLENWESAKSNLIRKKLLNSQGAITSKGRNALLS